MLKSNNKIAEVSILVLVLFLPYYSTIRGLSIIHLPSLVSSIIPYLRDLIILSALIFIKEKKTLEGISFFIKLYILILVFFAFITLFRGYGVVALKSIHLSLFPILAFYIARNVQNNNPLFFIKFLNFYIYNGLFVSIISFYFYFFRPQFYNEIFNLIYISDNTNAALNYTRMLGTFFSPNVFGVYMASLSLMSFIKIVNGKKNILNYFILFLTTINLILSFSRGSWVLEFVGLFTICLFNKKSFFTLLKVSFMTFILGSLTLSSLAYSSSMNIKEIISSRFNTLFSFENNTAYNRFENFDKVIINLNKNPLGSGLGAGSQSSAGNVDFFKEVNIGVIDSHYLKTLSEGGFLSLFIFLLLAIVILTSLIKKIKKSSKFFTDLFLLKREFLIFTLALFLGILTQSIGSNPFDFISTAPILWMFLGISARL